MDTIVKTDKKTYIKLSQLFTINALGSPDAPDPTTATLIRLFFCSTGRRKCRQCAKFLRIPHLDKIFCLFTPNTCNKLNIFKTLAEQFSANQTQEVKTTIFMGDFFGVICIFSVVLCLNEYSIY